MEVDKISKEKRCEERTRCKQVDGGVVQRLAGYLFTGLEEHLLICVCVFVFGRVGTRLCSNYIFHRNDLSGCLTVASF